MFCLSICQIRALKTSNRRKAFQHDSDDERELATYLSSIKEIKIILILEEYFKAKLRKS